MAQYFEKENEDPNVREEHLAQIEWENLDSLKSTWKQKVPVLNSYFEEVDNFEFEVEALPPSTPSSFKKPGNISR
jgi:hypothetical protein